MTGSFSSLRLVLQNMISWPKLLCISPLELGPLQTQTTLCSAFLATPLKDVWVIQVTSLKQSRWHEWSKQQKAKKYVMDWFHSNELKTLG